MATKELHETAAFSVALSPPSGGSGLEGFNDHGVRENLDDDGEIESIDVIFDAMEPGIRKDIEVDEPFLRKIAEKYNDAQPAMLDHSGDQLKQVGKVTAGRFADSVGKLRLMLNIPNTGNSVKSDVIADFTHSTGPQIEDGSVGMDPKTLEFADSDEEEAIAKFVDGDPTEFSLTPFPAGYDDGGLSPVFSDAVDSFMDDVDGEKAQSGESQLVVNDSKLTTK